MANGVAKTMRPPPKRVVDDADGHAADDGHAGQERAGRRAASGPQLHDVLEEAEAHGQRHAAEEDRQLDARSASRSGAR